MNSGKSYPPFDKYFFQKAVKLTKGSTRLLLSILIDCPSGKVYVEFDPSLGIVELRLIFGIEAIMFYSSISLWNYISLVLNASLEFSRLIAKGLPDFL